MENTAKKGFWGTFKEKHPAVAQFIVFFIISNGVTVLQMIMMPAIKYAFGFTSLVNTNFQILPIGHNPVSYTHLDVYKRQVREW